MEELNKQLLLDKFSKILDRAEEIIKADKEQVSKAYTMSDIVHDFDSFRWK